MKSGFKDHKTSWLYAFLPNESDGTKFGQCFFIGLGLSESFARTLLGENGYFIGCWHFRPNFKILWHASKRTLCLQKCWILIIYYVVILQYNFHAHGKSLKRKTRGGKFAPPPGSAWVENSPGLIGLKQLGTMTRLAGETSTGWCSKPVQGGYTHLTGPASGRGCGTGGEGVQIKGQVKSKS